MANTADGCIDVDYYMHIAVPGAPYVYSANVQSHCRQRCTMARTSDFSCVRERERTLHTSSAAAHAIPQT